MVRRPANNNGESNFNGSITACGDRAAQMSFVSAVMMIAEADDLLAAGDAAGGIGLYRVAIQH